MTFKMKPFVLLLMFVSASFASNYLSLDEASALLKKYVTKELSEEETTNFENLLKILSLPQYQSLESFRNGFTNPKRSQITCLVCQSVFETLFELVYDGASDETLINSLTSLCIYLGIQGENVCRGAVALNIPILAYIIRHEPEAQPLTFCSLYLQNAGNPNTCPMSDERFNWEVELPPVPTEPTPAFVENTTPLSIALITDAHIDPLYEPNSVANCGDPTCCRKGQIASSKSDYKNYIEPSIVEKTLLEREGKFLFDLNSVDEIKTVEEAAKREAKAMTRNDQPAGYWGDYRNCDTPPWAYDDVIDRIYEEHKDVDVIYYIGDSIDHFVWDTTYELINDTNRHVVEKIRNTFGEDIPIVAAIGNHEAQPTNQFAPSHITEDKLNTTWLYNALAEKWGDYLTEEAKESLMERGDFSLLIRPGLRAISINNNVAYRFNWWLVYDPQDSKKHLDWLVSELYKAELAGERVHILAHIPPGVHDLIYTWTREYNKIVNRFSSTIAAEFNGHTHSDEFRLFYDGAENTINVAFGAGSTTTYSDYNLNYKIAQFDNNYAPSSLVSYVYNLTEANLRPNQRPHWFMLYDMKNSFDLQDLSASSIGDLVIKMVTTHKHLLDIYAAFYSKLSDTRWQNCNTECKLDNLCKTVISVLWERERCDQLRTLYNTN